MNTKVNILLTTIVNRCYYPLVHKSELERNENNCKMQNNLKQVRTELGITQEELSKKSGISRTIISGLENGTIKSITTETMMTLAKSLSKEVSQIFIFS